MFYEFAGRCDTSPGSSGNVVAFVGASGAARVGQAVEVAPLMITTPLSGWFRCAGERGPGIAILLALVEVDEAGLLLPTRSAMANSGVLPEVAGPLRSIGLELQTRPGPSAKALCGASAAAPCCR